MGKNSIYITVIMPVYNGAQFLREAIESILTQSFTDFEFLIINDGSTDDSAMIISEYEKSDSRIIFLNQHKNSGLIEVLNLGLSQAKGKYIARMDADDVSLKNRFAEQYTFLEAHPEIGVLGCNLHFIDALGHRTSNFINNPPLPETSNQINWALCFSSGLMHPTIMARRDVILSMGGYEQNARHAEDYDLWVRLSVATKFYNLPQKLLLLRRHETNVTILFNNINLANSILICQRMLSSILGHDISDELAQILWHHRLTKEEHVHEIIKLFDELLIVFQQSYQLNPPELDYIKKDIVKREVEFFTQNITQLRTKALLQHASKIDPFELTKMILVTQLRKIYQIIKKSI